MFFFEVKNPFLIGKTHQNCSQKKPTCFQAGILLIFQRFLY